MVAQQLLPTELEAVRHLIGVLQPAFEVSRGVQSSSQTVAEAFAIVCRLRRTMAADTFSVPCEFDRPLAVGKKAILAFLEEDARRTDVMELDGRLFKFNDLVMEQSRGRMRLCEEARVSVRVLRGEIDGRFFKSRDNTKNWLKNIAVLIAVVLTPGGAAMLARVRKWVDEEDPTGPARRDVRHLRSSLEEPVADESRHRAALLLERVELLTTLGE